MEDINVLSYNTHCVPFVTTEKHVDNIVAYVGQLVNKYNVNIIALSEIFQPWVRKSILQKLSGAIPGSWKASPEINTPNSALSVSSGLLILWNSGTVQRDGSMHTIAYNNCCQMDCFSQKGALHVPLRVGGKILNVVHTHMQAWEIPVVCNGVRAGQFRQITNALKKLPSENTLIVGDFNTEPDKTFAVSNNLVVVPHVGTVPPRTYPNDGSAAHYYDHAYTTNKQARIQVASIGGDFGPSDHRAVIITL